MTLSANDYQTAALQTAIYPNASNNFVYPALGLVGEAGEVADKLKKVIRDNDGVLTDPIRESVAKELSDVCWYVAIGSDAVKVPLSNIQQTNINKLKARFPDKFSEENAINRNLDKERKILES